MLDNLTQEEIDFAYENAAKRRLVDDKDLNQDVVDMMQENNMIPKELIDEFKFPKEIEEPANEAETS